MIAGYILGIFVLLAASTLGLMEKALGPDSGRYPCVSRKLIWIMRCYTVVLAARSFFIIRYAYTGELAEPTADQLLAAGIMAMAHTGLLMQIIRQRLPIGVWRRLQARHARVRRAAMAGGPVGATLARVAADVDPIIVAPLTVLPADAPPEILRPVYDRLAELP